MLAYDLIGFQTVEDRQNFEDYLRAELGLTAVDGTVATEWGWTQLATFPIGIDVEEFAARANKAIARPEVSRLRSSLQGAKLVLGVDRLDYSKGLANRDARLRPHAGGRADIASAPYRCCRSRCRRAETSAPTASSRPNSPSLVGEVNGRHGEVDWTPIRYLNKGFSQLTLAGFYRTAHVGLVTPLHDGMNLVAKEYVASAEPVRSRRPGAVVVRRRRQGARCRAARQSTRYRRHGAADRGRRSP